MIHKSMPAPKLYQDSCLNDVGICSLARSWVRLFAVVSSQIEVGSNPVSECLYRHIGGFKPVHMFISC